MSVSQGRVSRVVWMGIVVGIVASSSGVAAARTAPEQACALAKSKAAAKRLGAELKCWQKAIAKGTSPDADCLAVAAEKFATAIGKADDKGGCIVAGDAGEIGSTVASCVDRLVNLTPAPAEACTASTASFGDKGALTGAATFEGGNNAMSASDDVLTFDALLEPSQPADALEVALYAGYGVFSGGPITPGVYELAGDELDFATCGICILLRTNVTSLGHDDDYMATGGTVTITAAGTAVGQTVAGSLSDVTLHHVHIDGATGETTRVVDTCSSMITSASFGATLEASP